VSEKGGNWIELISYKGGSVDKRGRFGDRNRVARQLNLSDNH